MSSAQDEFNSLVSHSQERNTSSHPEDLRSSTSTPRNSNHNDNAVDDYLTDDDDNTASRTSGSRNKSNAAASNGKTGSADMRSRYFLPTTIQSEANTGPKGVIADAHNFETAKRKARFSFFRSRSSQYNTNGGNHGAVSSIPEPYAGTATASSSMMGSVTDNSSEEEDDEFMARWRQTRLAQLQRESQPSRSRTVSPSKRIWGRLVDVDACGYLDAIEKVRADTIVVVLVYDDTSNVSGMVEDCVRTLARQYATIRFVKIHYEEAEFEGAGVPAMLAYRGGEKFAGLVPVMNEIPQDRGLSVLSLESVMKKHEILI